jgi:hypothetical protein
MPRATVNINDTQTFELRSLPEAFVTLRRLTYGEWLDRQTMSMSMEMSGDNRENATARMQIAQAAVSQYEFSKCIVDHNLEDDAGNKLDFRTKTAMTISLLDPRVGQEIGTLIDKMNQIEEGLGNSIATSNGH